MADSTELTKGITVIRGNAIVVSSREIPLNSNLVVTYSSADAPDGEIWFVVTTNDPDGIPFYREIELNRELVANGFSERFDPTDKNNADLNGDYDGDGVPNAVELLIGKDPGKRDILGIELNISVEWRMSEEDKKNLIYSIRKASDFIYDYTDGHAMITRVTIWDDKRNWDKADVRVHDTTWVIPQTKWELLYEGWPKAIVGGYWVKRASNATDAQKDKFNVMMSKRILSSSSAFSDKNIVVSLGEVDWAKTLGHELGHYVFWLEDEYIDWKGKIYYNPKEYGLNAIEFWFKEIPPHSVMNIQFRYNELSWPKDYFRFNSSLGEMFGDKWVDHTTLQWHDQRSCWETVVRLFTKDWDIKLEPDNILVHKPALIQQDILNFNSEYIPKTGPYTGVGYFMEVTWG